MENKESIWQKTESIPTREPLKGDLQTDVAVIGGGMAGILIAYQLKQRGMHAVVLEAGCVASGQTGRTTAKITSQHGLIYDRLAKQLGTDRAMQYARANEQAIGEYARIIQAERIDCDFRRASACLYSTDTDENLRREADTAASLGLDARFVAETELPFPVAGAVYFAGQAQFHPLKFLRPICDGLEIYEDTSAVSVEGNLIYTPGGRVRAEHIVFATHFPFVNVPGWYFMRMHQERSYVLALEGGWKPQNMYLGIDADGLSFREAEGLVLLGGGKHRTGENSAGGKYALLRRRARKLFPNHREIACWSAQDCITADGVPYIGRYAQSAPNWYVATGFGKWGMSSAMVAAMLISGQICGDVPDWAEVFSPKRFQLSASAKNLAVDAVQSAKGLARELFSIPAAELDALPPGHGGIVEVEGKKAGVYKDADGQCHIIDPRCPHLGCQLEWNPDEHSWDCPCHGSRFDCDGALLDNPAQCSLK